MLKEMSLFSNCRKEKPQSINRLVEPLLTIVALPLLPLPKDAIFKLFQKLL
jgi:hypothetical protein